MNKELMEKLYEKVGENISMLDNYLRFDTAKYVCYSEEEDHFIFAEFNRYALCGEEGYKAVFTREAYQQYVEQRKSGSTDKSITEAFQLLQSLAEQSNYDINITSVGTIIYDDAGDEIRGTPEQLYKILEAQINLRNLVKEVTGE